MENIYCHSVLQKINLQYLTLRLGTAEYTVYPKSVQILLNRHQVHKNIIV